MILYLLKLTIIHDFTISNQTFVTLYPLTFSYILNT